MTAQELIDFAYKDNIRIRLNIVGYENADLIMVGGAITTQELFDRLIPGLCHLFEDGRILRFGTQIGTVGNIELLDVVDGISV